MKKIGLITFHRAYNYGARLQAFALFHKLKLWGYDCTIVRYETPMQISQYKTLQKDFSLIGILRNIRNILNYNKNKKRQSCFDEFSNKFCDFTSVVCNKQQLQKLLNQFDIALVGSDQIWNIKEKKFDDAYLLPFSLKSKKISYASSTGDDIDIWTDEEIRIIVSNLKEFKSVSIRELSGKNMLASKGIFAYQVLDPTLLLEKLDWDQVKSDKIKYDEEYILYYSVKASDFSVDFTKHLSSKVGLKVIAIHPQNSYEIKSGFIRKFDIGPEGFIEYISKAKYIVTTSFHATVFSIIYSKQFLCPTKNERIIDFLKKLNLLDRVVESNEDYYKANQSIDWEFVHKRLSFLKQESLNYLETALNNE